MNHSESLQAKIKEHLHKKETDETYRRTYECEYRDLLIWLIKSEDEVEKQFPQHYTGMLDGPETVKLNEIGCEYRKRLKLLKEKYHKE